jgi:serpin B
MRRSINLVLIGLLLALSACAPAAPAVSPREGVDFTFLSSETSRLKASDVGDSELDRLVSGSNQFAFDLYGTIRESDGNLFLSPYSISLALAMLYAGARDETEAQMAEVMNFNLPQDRLHPAFNALEQALAGRGQSDETNGDNFQLNVANSIWVQQDYPVVLEYLDLLARHYGAGLRTLNFRGQPEPSRQVINAWVSEQTEERIQDLLPQGSINELTRLILVNAIYFNATWAHKFSARNTQDAPFYLLDGRQVTVPMMKQDEFFSYTSGEGYQAVSLPYQGWELSMLILLPEDGQYGEFEAGLDATQLDEILSQLERTQLILSMPRFSYESNFMLSAALSELGMPVAFDRNLANFSGMDGTGEFFIDEVLHKAFVAVDEEGTEAAAATAITVGSGAPQEPVEMTIDRPFIFLIRDNATNTILFLGRVMNPGS